MKSEKGLAVKEWVRSSGTGIVRLISNPKVRALSKLSHQVLNTIYRVKDGSTSSKIAAGLSLLHSVAESFEMQKMDGIDSFVKQHDLASGTGLLSKLVYTSGANLSRSNVASTDNCTLIEFRVNDKDRFYVKKQKNATSVSFGSDSAGSQIEPEFHTNRDFDFDNLFRILWEQFESGIFLKRNRHTYEFSVERLPVEDPIYIGKHDPVLFYKRLKRYLDAGISRSFLLNGPPGGGKSSFALKVARGNFTRIVKIDPLLLSSLESGELEAFLDQLKPEVLIFDDMDRVYGGVQSLLSTLENIKKFFPQMVIFASSNNAAGKIDPAILRPGRIDEIYEFEVPSEEFRRTIFLSYLNKYSISLSSSSIDYVVAKSGDLTPAFLKEIAIRSKVLTDDEVCEMVNNLNFYFAPVEEESDNSSEDKE